MNLFVDTLTNVDFSYLDPSRGLVGETWIASIELNGELDEQGMICDFGIVKKVVRQWLDTHIDHCLVVARHNPSFKEIKNNLYSIHLEWKMQDDAIINCIAPQQAITVTDTTEVSPSSIANWCIHQMSPLFPETVNSLQLKFVCESIDGPEYCYSHGLKKHDGNCQRIAHGHRSKIEIWRNNQLDYKLMHEWAKTFTDIYIGTKEDISTENNHEISFRYSALQGDFLLTLPKHACYIINSDSTVELIGKHIAHQIKASNPNDTIRVKAYEGLGKGAIIEV